MQRIHFHRKLKQLFFFWMGLNSLCSYSFWRPSNYFLSSWTVAVFDPGGIIIFYYLQFSRCAVCHFYTCIKKGTFNHFGRSETWIHIIQGTCSQAWEVLSLFLSLFFLCLALFSLVVVVMVCVRCGGGGVGGGGRRQEKGRDKSDHLVAGSLRSFPQDNWHLTALSDKTNVQRNREHVVLDLFSNFKWVRFSVTFGEPLKHVINLRGPFMASRKLAIRDEPNIRLIKMLKSCQTFTWFTDEKTRGCWRSPPPHPHPVPSPPSRVSIRHVSVCTGTTRTCVSTCARGAGTDGDVVDGHIPHTTHHTAPQNTTQHNTIWHTTPHHNNTTTTPHGDRKKTEKDWEGEREEKEDRERRADERERERGERTKWKRKWRRRWDRARIDRLIVHLGRLTVFYFLRIN